MFLDKNHNIDDPCCTFIGKVIQIKFKTVVLNIVQPKD